VKVKVKNSPTGDNVCIHFQNNLCLCNVLGCGKFFFWDFHYP